MIEVDTSNFYRGRYGLERIQVSRVYRLFVSNRGTGGLTVDREIKP